MLSRLRTLREVVDAMVRVCEVIEVKDVFGTESEVSVMLTDYDVDEAASEMSNGADEEEQDEQDREETNRLPRVLFPRSHAPTTATRPSVSRGRPNPLPIHQLDLLWQKTNKIETTTYLRRVAHRPMARCTFLEVS